MLSDVSMFKKKVNFEVIVSLMIQMFKICFQTVSNSQAIALEEVATVTWQTFIRTSHLWQKGVHQSLAEN